MSSTNSRYTPLNSSRRYILQQPTRIYLNNDHRKQIVGKNSLKRIHRRDSFQLTNQSQMNIVDPWVNELLQRDFDFSQINDHQSSIEFVNISPPTTTTTTNPSSSLSQKNFSKKKKNFNQRIRDDDFSSNDFIRKDPRNDYRLISLSQSQLMKINPTTKWIIGKPFNSNNSIQFASSKRIIQQQNYPNKEEERNDKNVKRTIWNLYNWKEKRNIFIYMLGIMFYKFGLEAFNGSIISLASNRYDRDTFFSGSSSRTFEKVGLLIGLNQACQCIGSILISPLIKHYSTRIVLSFSIFLFALLTALLMIIDVSTGGKIKPSNYYPMHEHDYSYYGKYPTNIIIPIYCLTGIAYGMVELIRRIIPRDIVGSNEEKLQRMDALVHVFYEISGVSGALITGLLLIPRLGTNYAFIITPILFTCASFIWTFLNSSDERIDLSLEINSSDKKRKNYFQSILQGFLLFGQSIYFGGKLILTNRKYLWLFPCYSLTLYIHRYLENGIAPQIAKRYLNNSEWSQIIVGGSNFGELCGALTVFFLTKKIRSPIVWLRFDCLLLLLVWYIPFYNPQSITITNAWIIALSFIPLGFGGACDDVSLNAHLQSILNESQFENKDISSLGSVMAFLYSSYIILYAILNPLLGKYIDSIYNQNQTIRPALIYTVGVQITIVSFIVFLATFIPHKSFRFNPSLE